MFDLDRWQEIFASIRSNILRTVLSGFTVALGLFIFIVLFGIGTGLQNAFTEGFARDATNLISIYTGKTTIAFEGLQSDRTVVLKNQDFEDVVNENEKNIEYSAPTYQSFMTVKYGNESGNYQIVGTSGDEKFIENRKLVDGRYVNAGDINRRLPVAVIGRMVQRDLIKDGSPIGKELALNGTVFKVIGVFSDEGGGDWEERVISVPISTLQQLKKGSDTLNSIQLTYNQELSPNEAIEFGDKLEKEIKAKLKVAPDDENGIRVRNNAKNTEDTFAFLAILTGIVGFIGIGTLAAGIIGISNIMVYIVKERTQEIGVRKAIGAKPKSIVGLILQESIVITVISGIVGVGMAVLTLYLIGDSLEKYFIKDPSVGWGMIFVAFILLVLAGLIAGFVPAYRASKIKPIEALRSE